MHAEKVDELSRDLLSNLYMSVEIVLSPSSTFGSDVIKMCLEFITAMAKHVYNTKEDGKESQSLPAMEHFLKVWKPFIKCNKPIMIGVASQP